MSSEPRVTDISVNRGSPSENVRLLYFLLLISKGKFGNVDVRGSHVVVDLAVHSTPAKSVRSLGPGSPRPGAMQTQPGSVFIKRVPCYVKITMTVKK